MDSIGNKINAVLVRFDPINIYFEDIDNKDEYSGEAEEIARNIENCETEHELNDLVYKIFSAHFGLSIAGKKNHYTDISKELWNQLRNSTTKKQVLQ